MPSPFATWRQMSEYDMGSAMVNQPAEVNNVCEARYVDTGIAAAFAALTPQQVHDYGGDGGIGSNQTDKPGIGGARTLGMCFSCVTLPIASSV